MPIIRFGEGMEKLPLEDVGVIDPFDEVADFSVRVIDPFDEPRRAYLRAARKPPSPEWWLREMTVRPFGAAFDLLSRFLPRDSFEKEVAKAQAAFHYQQEMNKMHDPTGRTEKFSLSEVYGNLPAFEKALGIEKDPTPMEVFTVGGSALIATALGVNPLLTVAGLVTFQGLAEIQSAVVNLLKKEGYQVFQNKGIVDLLPEDISQNTKDVVMLLNMFALGWGTGKIFNKAPSAYEKLTKKIVEKHNLPSSLFIDPQTLRTELQMGGVLSARELGIYRSLGLTGSQVRNALRNGLHIEVPFEKIVTVSDRPWFAQLKKVLKIDPSTKITYGYAGKPRKGVAGLIEYMPETPLRVIPPEVFKARDFIERSGNSFLGVEGNVGVIASGRTGKVDIIPLEKLEKPDKINLDAEIDALLKGDWEPELEKFLSPLEKLVDKQQMEYRASLFKGEDRTKQLEAFEIYKGVTVSNIIEKVFNKESIVADIEKSIKGGVDIKELSNNINELFVSNFAREKDNLNPLQELEMLKVEVQLRTQIAQGYESYLLNREHGIIDLNAKIELRNLRDMREDVTKAIPALVELGKDIWNKGHTSYTIFRDKMKETLKGLWEIFKDNMLNVWNMVKTFNARLGERGNIRLWKQYEKAKEAKRLLYRFTSPDAIEMQVKKGLHVDPDISKIEAEPYKGIGTYFGPSKEAVIKTLTGQVTPPKQFIEDTGNVFMEAVLRRDARIMQIEDSLLKERFEIFKHDKKFENIYEATLAWTKHLKQSFDVIKITKPETPDEFIILNPKSIKLYYEDRKPWHLKIDSERNIKGLIHAATGLKGDSSFVIEMTALNAAFKKAVQTGRIAYREGRKEGVEETKKHIQEILERREQLLSVKDARDVLTGIKEKALRGGVSVDYQVKIRELFEGVDFTKPSEKVIENLKGLKDFIEREGVPLGISEKELGQLRRLTQIPFKDMSTQAQIQMLETASKLYNLGALKKSLKKSKQSRELEKEHNELIAQTRNYDPVLSNRIEPTRLDMVKVGLKKLNLELLHTSRVADLADGNKNYKGKNALMIKEQMNTEYKTRQATEDSIRDVLEDIAKLGINEINKEQGNKIILVLMNEQGARGQVRALLKEFGYDKVPELSIIERKIVMILRDALKRQLPQISKVYEEREGLIFPVVENYFPIRYPRELNIFPRNAIMHNRNRTKEVEQRFVIKRKDYVEELPRTDFLNVFGETVFDQMWYIHMQPVLDKHAALIRTPEYKEVAGELLWNWWRDQIDIVANKGMSSVTIDRWINEWLREARTNLNYAVLGFKLSAILMQPFAVFDAISYAYMRWGLKGAEEVALEFSKAWLNPIAAHKFVETSPALKRRRLGEPAMEELSERAAALPGGIWRSFLEASMKGLQEFDILTAAGVEKGLLKLIEKYEPGIDAKAEADFLMNLVSSSAEVTLKPHILSRGEGMRIWFTFQTFFLNRWGFLTHDIIREGFKKGWKHKYKALVAIGIMMAGGLAEQEARDRIFEFTTGKEARSERDFWNYVLLYLPRQTPFIGSVFEQWATAEPPLLRMLGTAGEGISQLTKGELAPGFEKILEAFMILYLGVPGTVQMFDFLGRITEEEPASEGEKR